MTNPASAPAPSVAPGSGAPAPRLGDLLIEMGLITQDQLRIALLEQRRSQQPLRQCVLALGFVTE